ncbi:MAG: hypothetical protein DRO15_04255 [Thermoprotei archaeon]|nr:MAG: hypothetical protein DRO15_04255 [Thermoprotei archaeon]
MKIVKNCAHLIKRLNEILRYKLYAYNELIRKTGFYLKPIHIVTKRTKEGKRTYYYFGRYWYKLETYVKDGKRRLKWIYIGTSKPSIILPEPPKNPLENCIVIVKGNDLIVSDKCYERVINICKSIT